VFGLRHDPEPQKESDQMYELETQRVIEGVLVESESMEGSPTHNPAIVDAN